MKERQGAGEMADEREFPADWTEWQQQWSTWRSAHGLRLSTQRIRGKNFLADEVLGTFKIRPGEVAELSAVTMPNLTERDANGRLIEKRCRYVGITWLGELASGINGGLVSTFSELEQALAAGVPQDA